VQSVLVDTVDFAFGAKRSQTLRQAMHQISQDKVSKGRSKSELLVKEEKSRKALKKENERKRAIKEQKQRELVERQAFINQMAYS